MRRSGGATIEAALATRFGGVDLLSGNDEALDTLSKRFPDLARYVIHSLGLKTAWPNRARNGGKRDLIPFSVFSA